MYKLVFDSVISLIVLFILSPFLLLISLLIKIDDWGPVLYRSVRVGKNRETFKMLKFRTMVVNADKIGGSSTPLDDPRLTRIGRMLRKYKLDEIPQFLNVLMGHMSIVGPRPQVPWAVALYNEEEKLLLSLKPGIIDYASIKFRNESEVLKGSPEPDRDYLIKIAPEKNRLALEYIKRSSLRQDLKIIFLGIKTVFIRNKNTINLK